MHEIVFICQNDHWTWEGYQVSRDSATPQKVKLSICLSTIPRSRFNSEERTPVPIGWKAEWAPEAVWTQWRGKKFSLAGTEIRSSALNQSLYRVSYRGDHRRRSIVTFSSYLLHGGHVVSLFLTTMLMSTGRSIDAGQCGTRVLAVGSASRLQFS